MHFSIISGDMGLSPIFIGGDPAGIDFAMSPIIGHLGGGGVSLTAVAGGATTVGAAASAGWCPACGSTGAAKAGAETATPTAARKAQAFITITPLALLKAGARHNLVDNSGHKPGPRPKNE